jgi:cupin 2 domain-containing protein
MDIDHVVCNVFESIPEYFDEEIVDCLVENKQLKIERIVSKGHTSPSSGWYDQVHDEWVIVLKGGAIIAFESDVEVTLKAGDSLSIAAHSKHRVKWTDPEQETVWVAVHY